MLQPCDYLGICVIYYPGQMGRPVYRHRENAAYPVKMHFEIWVTFYILVEDE